MLYRRYVPAITRYIAYRVSDEAVVEDLTAEVFLRMVESLPQYRITGAPFEAWLYRIAATRVADYYRYGDRVPGQLGETLSSGDPPLELTILEREEFETLRAALRQLTGEQQMILILRFIERKSHREVAAIVGKSERAVAAAQHRALKKLSRNAIIYAGKNHEPGLATGTPRPDGTARPGHPAAHAPCVWRFERSAGERGATAGPGSGRGVV